MKVIDVQKKLCLCCMEEHDVHTVTVREKNTFKGTEVEYDAKNFYCDRADEYFCDEEMISVNDVAMKNAFRKATGLLSSDEIAAIRQRYGISQSDLCLLLGWGAKTVTRYESHQVQDIAHDTILRKIDNDPEWFISLLEKVRDQLSPASYEKYMAAASHLYELDHDLYLKRAIMAKYARFQSRLSLSGNTVLSLDKVVDTICYFSNSVIVTALYKVKLMKLLWYADALAYKRRGSSITGLVYQAMPMGAVPIAHDSIIDFSRINCEEVEISEGTGYHFQPTTNTNYCYLTEEEIGILDEIIRIFGKASRDEIVYRMHQETAYTETAPRDIIQFKYAAELSIS